MLEQDLLRTEIPDNEPPIKGTAQKDIWELWMRLQNKDLVLVSPQSPNQFPGVRVPELDGGVGTGRDHYGVIDRPSEHENLDLCRRLGLGAGTRS